VNVKRKKHESVMRGTTFIVTGKEAEFGIVKVYRLCPLVLMAKVRRTRTLGSEKGQRDGKWTV
jgi:hypothetical protein